MREQDYPLVLGPANGDGGGRGGGGGGVGSGIKFQQRGAEVVV